MKTKLFLFAAAAACAFTFTACDDDDDNVVANPAQSRTQMLVGKDWAITSAVETVNGQTTDILAAMPATSRDDVFIFSENGEAVRNEGKTKQIGDPQIVEASEWRFREEERMLKVDFVSLPTDDEIVEISQKRIVLRNVGPSSSTLTTFEVAE